jgi:hypothetical protein
MSPGIKLKLSIFISTGAFAEAAANRCVWLLPIQPSAATSAAHTTTFIIVFFTLMLLSREIC